MLILALPGSRRQSAQTWVFGVELSSRFSASMGGLQVFSEEGGLVFSRGWRTGAAGSRDRVLILRPASEPPTPATLDRLAHEYSFKDKLDSTWAVRPLELVRGSWPDRSGA